MKTENRSVVWVFLMLFASVLAVVSSGLLVAFSKDSVAATYLAIIEVMSGMVIGQIMTEITYDDIVAAAKTPFAIFRKPSEASRDE